MLRKLFGTKSLAAISVLMLFTLLASTVQSHDDVTRVCCDKDRAIEKLREAVGRDLDVLAGELSVMLAQDATKGFFAEKIINAKKRTVGLAQTLAALRGKDTDDSGERIQAATRIVQKIESAMAESGLETPRLDIKLPVEAHVGLLRKAKRVFVAIAPLVDEKDVDKVIAFSNGKRLELAASAPPKCRRW